MTEKLKQLSREEGATLFMTLLAAWDVLLMRYSGQEDLVVGTPIANRTRVETEELIGCFMNTLVLRVDATGNPRFRELLQRAKQVALGGYAHQDVPFEKVVEELQPKRDLSRSPLFQVMFVLQNAPMTEAKLGGLTLEQVEFDHQLAKFDLTLAMAEGDGRLGGTLEYNTDLFEAETIERMAEHWKGLLKKIVEDPEKRIWQLPLMGAEEQRQLVQEWNRTEKPFPSAQSLHSLIEHQAAASPDAIALSFGDRSLTYRELNARANQLARYLQSRGVRSETLVGVFLERSLDMVVALLAILKAGGAYVPLDPTHPSERVRFMMEDSRMPILVTHRDSLKNLPANGVEAIYLDLDHERIAQELDANLPPSGTPDSLAYVIYTSGSTGKPKGVMIRHRSVVNFLESICREPGVTSRDVLLAITTFTFDIAGLELYAPLIKGARVEIATRDVALDPVQLSERIRSLRATVMQATPATWRMLIDSGWTGDRNLKILCGGEALPSDLANELLSRGESVWNLYGPTETTIWSTLHRVEPTQTASVPIGRPIANTQVYVLDRWLNHVPVGVAGELHIGGIGLARGYWNQPELTAEKFIPDPFGAGMDARLYKTGDQVRYLSDGTLEFLGRIDHQVKIRGLRIELGEIEAVLKQHPDVNESVVLAREDVPGQKRLVAYVVPAANQAEPTITELRNWVRERLPEYMVPAIFLMLPALPLTPNGKTDRRALPAPDSLRPELVQSYVAPHTAAEEVHARIWADALKLDRVGVHDNFFELGGDSILAIQIISRANQAGFSLTARQLFQYQTIAELATVGNENKPKAAEGHTPSQFSLVKLDETDLDQLAGNHLLLEDAYPLSPIQHGLLFHSLYAGESGTYFMQLTFKLQGEFDPRAFQDSWTEVVNRHPSLRTAFRWQEMDEPLQIVYKRVEIPFEHMDWSSRPAAQHDELLRAYLQEQRKRGFDLTKAPLLRLTLINLGDGAFQCVWAWSHLILDGWSLPLVLKEVFSGYQERLGRSRGSIKSSEPYRNYIAWLQDQDLSKAEAFWREALKGFVTPTSLGIDRPATVSPDGDYGEQSALLSVNASAELLAFSKRQQITLNVLAQAAWALLLCRYSGERDVVFGATLSGRPAALSGVESMVGLFINTLPVRVRISNEDLPGPWLRKLQAEQVELREYQYSPLVRVREWSELPVGAQLFESIFVFENYPVDSSGNWNEGLQISNVRSLERTNYPLTLIVAPGKQLLVRALYERGRFDDASIAKLLGHYLTLLQGMLAHAERPVCRLPILTESERRQLIERNQTARSFSVGKSIHELFETQAHQTPERIAVACDKERISYADLNRRSNQLACYLRERGVGRGSVVALCMDRSIDAIASLLGILKSGAAYLPVDPAYPKDRIAFMLEDASVEVILTQQNLLGGIPPTKANIISIDNRWNEIARSEVQDLPRVSPDDLLYVIYTSGSTGQPKGVQVSHRAMANVLESIRLEPGLTARDIVLAITTLSFDIAGFEIYLPLIVGARVEIATREAALDPLRLSAKLRSTHATVMQATPVTWRMLVNSGWKGNAGLKILSTGEALPVDLANELVGRGESVWNLYGPTETTIWSTLHKVERTDLASVPIGHPIANTQVFILDAYGNLVPDGLAGEFYIAGSGLAQGYLNRPELTAERFVPNPFDSDSRGRMYRTGDLARWRSDGSIEYLGRTDHQVKIRGHRIELGEIEAVLQEHESVRQAVVIARQFDSDDKRLIAYVVPAKGRELVVSDLTALLSSKLPGYMVPSRFITLEQFPLTPNGKIDRKALPSPNQVDACESAEPVAARDGLELQLQHIWERVLRMRPVGIRQNFFELGGNSLLAVRMFAELEKVFGQSIPLATLFQAPTIEEFADVLRREDWSAGWSSLVPLQPSGSAPPFFCVHSLGSNLVSYARLARYVGLDQPFFGLQPVGLDGREAPHKRIEDMATHYLREIRAIQPEGPYYLGGVCMGGVVAFDMAQKLRAAGQEVAFLLLIDAGFPGKPKYMRERAQYNGLGAVVDYYIGDLLIRSPNEKLIYIATRLRNITLRLYQALLWLGKKAHVFRDHQTNFERIIRSVRQANRQANNYIPERYPGKVTLFWCSDTPSRSFRDRRLAWSQVAAGGLEVHAIPGDHLSMVEQPNVVSMAEELKACLTNSQQRSIPVHTLD